MISRGISLVNSSNSVAYLTFLAYNHATKRIALNHIDLNTMSPVQGIPLEPLFSRKFEYTKQYDGGKRYIGETQGNEMVEDFNIGVTIDVDMSMVEKGIDTYRERTSRSKLENILNGGLYLNGQDTYKVLGIAGNVNFESVMTGKNVNRHWQYLTYRENAFLKDGTSYEKDDLKVKVIKNSLLSTYNLSTLGMIIEWHIATGSGETQIVRFPLVGFNQLKLNIDSEKNTLGVNLQIKSDAIQTGDLFVNGGSEEGLYWNTVKAVEFYTGTPTIPASFTAGANYLLIEKTTGEVRFIKDVAGTLTDVSDTTIMDLGTVFYVQKYDTGAKAGGGVGFCDADSIVEKTPKFVAVGKFDCVKKKSFAVQWQLDEEAVPTDKTVFLLDVLGYNGEKGQFTLYDSENL